MIISVAACVLILASGAYGQDYATVNDIYYKSASADEYSRQRCKLDVYHPAGRDGFKTIVWFHGGGLIEGSKQVPAELRQKGVCVVAVNYRLSPMATAPAYIEDAAAAIAWTFANISRYGGNPEEIYVGGHSAGGYLALMAALDESYLAAHGIASGRVKGWFPVSGQTATHYQIRAELGLPMDKPYFDKYAPLYHVRPDTSPILLTAGNRDLDMACRTAENFYLSEALKSAGNKNVTFYELDGFDHNTVMQPACSLILKEMRAR